MTDGDAIAATADVESFDLVIAAIKDDIRTAAMEPCNPKGHDAICRGQTGMARALSLTFHRLDRVPGDTVALLRSEVITLVDSHAEDAVIRHLARRVPVGQAAVVSRESAPGWLASVGTTLRTVGVPGAVVAVSGVVGLALWIVLEVVKR